MGCPELKREEMRGKIDERGSQSHNAMWMLSLHLTVLLIPFDHFNGLSHGMG